jgi:N6-adenosine-specific RNA methylase IME4
MSAPLPTVPGGFKVVCADPPWHFKSNSKARPGRNAMGHYACMPLADIAALPVRDVVADKAALFLWITGPFLAIGAHLPIMRAWGFKPSGMGFTWTKLNKRAATLFICPEDVFMGGGLTTRKNAEFCVIGKRGKSVRRSASVREAIISPVREHSRKPDEFYDRVQQYAEGPYLELFARQSRPGWVTWGDEASKFDALAARPTEGFQPLGELAASVVAQVAAKREAR